MREGVTLEGTRVLVTGATGQVGGPLALALSSRAEVWAAGRFSDPAAKQRLEAAGARCVTVDLARGDVSGLPDNFDYAVNFAVAKSGQFDVDMAVNAEAVGLLMSRCRNAHAFLHCSSTAVYQPDGHHRFGEHDPLGDNHRVIMPTYSITKIAGEAVARQSAREWGLATTIARLNVPYGDTGGWPAFHLAMMTAGQSIPVHVNAPSLYNPIHEDDIIEQVPKLLEVASVPATVVNWAGRDQVSIEEWCSHLGGLAGVEPRFEPTEQTLESVTTDNTLMHRLIGETRVAWQDGMRRMVSPVATDPGARDW